MTIDCIAVVSGGMDSVTLLHWLVKAQKRTPAVISFLYGQRHTRELACARENAALLGLQPPQVVDLSPLAGLFNISSLVNRDLVVPTIDTVEADAMPSTYVPNRNMIFLALAVAWAETLGAREVYCGAQAHDLYGYWDTTPEFMARLNAVYALNTDYPVQVLAPFETYSKTDVLRAGLELGVDYGKTWSCYAGEDLACGQCPTCAERLKAFAELGLKDPLPYQHPNS